MIDKQTRKRLKQIGKKISQLKKQTRKLELRPCHNDAELKQKDQDINALREQVHHLEKEQDTYILQTGNIKHSL
jgi:chromosome segregation ATPase